MTFFYRARTRRNCTPLSASRESVQKVPATLPDNGRQSPAVSDVQPSIT